VTGTATATVLFCDIVDSTQHRAVLGEVLADQFFRAAEDAFRDAIDRSGGRVLKGAGDGVMALFDSASEAVSGAVALQRGVRSISPDIELRVGIASGDVTYEQNDCFGMPVVIAARLEHACTPGRILVSSAVRLLAGDRAVADYEHVGSLELKGVPEPIEAFAVLWEALDDAASAWSFPTTLPAHSEHPCVGRAPEIAALAAAWDRARAGVHSLVLVGGEAGVGKTRLATELARRCHRDGGVVLAGLCDRDLSLPYQPWVMIVDQLVSQLTVDTRDEVRSELAALSVLVPQLTETVGGLPRIERLDPEAERLRLFDSVSTVLGLTADVAPLLMILDDLHWARKQTLDLLRYLLISDRSRRCLVVATHRDTATDLGEPFERAVAELRRLETVVQVKVGGIDADAVEELLEHNEGGGGGRDDPDRRRRAEVIAERTRGNAFLVTELLRDRIDAVPESVIDVVRGRLTSLGGDARSIADIVSVAGRIELPVLVEAARAWSVDVAPGLRELIRAGLVVELDGPVPAYQFAHALIRDAVGHDLPAFEAVGLHHGLALAIEHVHAADRRPVLPELAKHFAAASPYAGWEKAAYYGRRAAAHARRTAAYEEAIALIETALDVTPSATRERAELLVDAVDLLERCGRNPEAVELAEEADEVAAELGDLALQARASIELERAAHLANSALDRSLPRLRRVLAGGDGLPEDALIRVMASLGRASWLNGLSEGPVLATRALEAARRLDDPATIGHALEMACVLERDPHAALSMARELEQVTGALGAVFQSMWAMTRQTDALLILGRLAEAEMVLGRLQQLAEQYRFTSYLFLSHVFTHTLALAAGEFELAEEASEAAEQVERSEGLDAAGAYGLQMFMIRRTQGRLEEMRPVLRLIARDPDPGGVWRPGLVLAFAELGMLDEAADGFERVMSEHWGAIPRDSLWPLALSLLADTCVALDRGDAAELLLAELEPLAGFTIRAGYTTNGGPADRCRAALAELTGRDRRSAVHTSCAPTGVR
jgi:class 3 adenylate cyclase/tetratricopeptide (TPR) repeat protein